MKIVIIVFIKTFNQLVNYLACLFSSVSQTSFGQASHWYSALYRLLVNMGGSLVLSAKKTLKIIIQMDIFKSAIIVLFSSTLWTIVLHNYQNLHKPWQLRVALGGLQVARPEFKKSIWIRQGFSWTDDLSATEAHFKNSF